MYANREAESMVVGLLQTFETALKHGDDESKDTTKYLDIMVNICELQKKSRCYEKALEAAKKRLADDEKELDDDEKLFIEVDTIYEKEFNNCMSKFNMQPNVKYKEFEKHLAELASSLTAQSSENDDFVVEDSEVNVLDPLTKLRMTDPVRNTNCNHRYEKSTILEWIANNDRCRCPVTGCGNKDFITSQSLEDDKVFKMRLRAMAESD